MHRADREEKWGEGGMMSVAGGFFFMVAQWRNVKRKKAGGSRVSAPRGEESREERAGTGPSGGHLRRPASNPDRQARATWLPHDRGVWRGATTLARVTDRRGRATPGPGGSGWVQEGA
jgi:hypothetical protein